MNNEFKIDIKSIKIYQAVIKKTIFLIIFNFLQKCIKQQLKNFYEIFVKSF